MRCKHSYQYQQLLDPVCHRHFVCHCQPPLPHLSLSLIILTSMCWVTRWGGLPQAGHTQPSQ
jgi:hypothetical protein